MHCVLSDALTFRSEAKSGRDESWKKSKLFNLEKASQKNLRFFTTFLKSQDEYVAISKQYELCYILKYLLKTINQDTKLVAIDLQNHHVQQWVRFTPITVN